MATHHDLAISWRTGREEALSAGEGETVLRAAESADVSLPFGCRTGACASCVGRLVYGAVDYVRPPRALRDQHVDGGYVLCCIARPRTDCRIVVGADVRRDLMSNPWK